MCIRWRQLTDVSNGSKNAVGEIIPVRLLTTIAMPVSMNGSLKSTTASRSALIINDVSTISALRFIKSAINPFHFPFSRVPHLPSSTRTSSYVKPFQIFFFLLEIVWKKGQNITENNYLPRGSANFSSKSMQNPEQH